LPPECAKKHQIAWCLKKFPRVLLPESGLPLPFTGSSDPRMEREGGNTVTKRERNDRRKRRNRKIITI